MIFSGQIVRSGSVWRVLSISWCSQDGRSISRARGVSKGRERECRWLLICSRSRLGERKRRSAGWRDSAQPKRIIHTQRRRHSSLSLFLSRPFFFFLILPIITQVPFWSNEIVQLLADARRVFKWRRRRRRKETSQTWESERAGPAREKETFCARQPYNNFNNNTKKKEEEEEKERGLLVVNCSLR